MENLSSLNSILPFLPVVSSSSTSSSYNLSWPKQTIIETLNSLTEGPALSGVDSGEVLFDQISILRNSLDYPSSELSPGTEEGYIRFFDELMAPAESKKWFGETVPALAALLLKLPSQLEAHYRDADEIHSGAKEGYPKIRTGLRMLNPQEPGMVFLSLELIGALLACSFFCLFPTVDRHDKLPKRINFDFLFANLHFSSEPYQEQKIRCLIHYFERISACLPMHWVSFERKVIPLAPKAELWRKSTISLCEFEVVQTGFIEMQTREALEVDFANKYIGGGALGRGCLQEEIRFMINPELIAGMLFLPCMGANEAIEIVGAERFSKYSGYRSSFFFRGEYTDKKLIDCMGRRKTRIIAIDAIAFKDKAGLQFRAGNLLREVNKAWCGFQESSISGGLHPGENEAHQLVGNSHGLSIRDTDVRDDIGIATGNWGCGDFGGDPELKAMIQWLAASQALRPFISYYTCKNKSLESLEKVTRFVQSKGWTVGDLWNKLVEYSTLRVNRKTSVGLLSWLLPSSSAPPALTRRWRH